MVKTVIIVDGGMVRDVFSTLPESEHEIKILDLDCAESFEEKDELEAWANEVSASPAYQLII